MPNARRLPTAVWGAAFIPFLWIGASAIAAQQPKSKKVAMEPVKLSTVLAAFLADSGARTRGLPWTTGSELPVKWEAAQPSPTTDPYLKKLGHTLTRTGKFRGTVGGQPAQEMTLTLSGTEAGLARVSVGTPMDEITREQIEQSLKADGMTLQPLKCSREKEGASFGNLLDAARVPGKTASGLWWNWNCAHDGCMLGLTILYRKAEASEIECYSGG